MPVKKTKGSRSIGRKQNAPEVVVHGPSGHIVKTEGLTQDPPYESVVRSRSGKIGKSEQITMYEGGILRLHIDGEWSSVNFESVFGFVNVLYAVMKHRALGASPHYPVIATPNAYSLQNTPQRMASAMECFVTYVKYGSPGVTDFLGVGQVMKEIREIISSLLTLKTEHQMRKLEVEERQQQVLSSKIKNAQSLFDLAKSAGLAPSQIKPTLELFDRRQDEIIGLIQEGKIVNVEATEGQLGPRKHHP